MRLLIPVLLVAAPLLGQEKRPPILGQEQVELSEATYKRVTALEDQKDWPQLVATIGSLPFSDQVKLTGTYLKALSKSAQWETMLRFCERAIPVLDGPKPRLSVARIGWAQALGALGQAREAARVHLQNGALGFADGYPNALALALQSKDYAYVIETANHVLAAKPSLHEAGALKGEALAKLGRFAEAEPFLMEATARLPKRATSWADLACCQQERGAVDAALASATQALTLDPRLIEARYNRARALMTLKRYPEAREDLAAGLTLDPAPETRASLETILSQVDRYLEGVKRAEARTAQRQAPRSQRR